jgi:D-alanyl-D-alanine carboxypeptidase
VGHRSSVSLEIASLTKIMTFYTVVNFVKEKGIDIKTEKIKVSAEAFNITGTSAELVEGD